ncbi:MAG: GntR family transcriptional regulator [Candidatus Sulfotelmatobacter sp.]
MTLAALDRTSILPLYYQIQQSLLDQIRSGTLKAGDPVPSEQEIAVRLGVSRMTARQALKSLRDIGLTYAERGRGTFVSANKLEKNIRQVLSFTEEMVTRGLRATSKLLLFETVEAGEEIAAALHIAKSETLIGLQRIRLADTSPMGIECSYIPQRLCPDLLQTFDPTASLYQVLSERYGIRMAVADEVVEAGLASASEARILQIPKRSPVFMFTRVSRVQSGQPVEYVKSTYRADRYKIRHRLTRLNQDLLAK